MKLQLGKLLNKRGLKQVWLIDQLGLSPGYVSSIVNGTKVPSPKTLQRIADALDVPVSTLFDTDRSVAVAGRVGGGQSVELVDAYAKGGGLYHVASPEDIPAHGIVAVEVAGDSMAPLIESGDILFFTRHFLGVDPNSVGHVSICQTVDGRALVKQIRPGREDGTFDLHSINPSTPPEYGVRLLWAAPYRRHLRRADVEISEP